MSINPNCPGLTACDHHRGLCCLFAGEPSHEERERMFKLGLCRGCGQPEEAHRVVRDAAKWSTNVRICPTNTYQEPEKP